MLIMVLEPGAALQLFLGEEALVLTLQKGKLLFLPYSSHSAMRFNILNIIIHMYNFENNIEF